MKDEAQLIDKALQGDTAAFGSLVRAYQDRLYTSVVHILGCEHLAEDVVQDAFVRAYVKLSTFRRSSSFYTWLYRIALNVAINSRRRKPTVPVDSAREESVCEPLDPLESPACRLMREERARQVQAALASLDEQQRAVIVLREIEGCDYETIAEILNISIGTVRSRLHRARAVMRRELRQVHLGQ